jgi:hypothetical protein
MKCEFTEQVSLLIDGELPPAQAAALHYHLSSCGECQEARADFLNLRREIGDYELDLSPVFQDRVLAEILADRVRSPGDGFAPVVMPVTLGWRERVVAAFRVPRFGSAFAAALGLVLVVGAGFLIYHGTHRSSGITNPSSPDRQLVIAVASPAPSPAQPQLPPEKPELTAQGEKSQKRTIPTTVDLRHVRPGTSPSPSPPNTNDEVAVGPPVEIPGQNPADAESLAARHSEQSGLLLLAFRNHRAGENADLSHEKQRARQLLYQNIVLRREATDAGDMSTATLLDSLEPILIDIANLPDRARAEDVQAIKGRIERKNLVPLLQVNSTELARLND